MSNVSEPKNCPKCGASIPAEAPQGLCPKCLLLEISAPTDAGQSAHGKSTPPTRDELVAAFPHLEILELIGQGGMGFVFKARQPKLDRFVALKILPQSLAADPAFAERFTREGRLLARLNHPNIVTVHDFGVASGLRPEDPQFFYLLMEYVDGVNLRQAMRAGRFTADQALAVVPKICEALQFAHNEGILHRDIKPENILLDTKGRVKIADFGIAKLVAGRAELPLSPNKAAPQCRPTDDLTQTGKTLGTPNYMAPEQIEKRGEVDHRADIYSLGVVFYEILTGELPLGKFAPPSQKSAADPRLDDVVLRALEKEPDRRTQSAGEVKTQVETIAATPPHVAREKAPSTQKLPSRFWKRFAIIAGIALLGLILIPVIAILLAIAYPTFQKANDKLTVRQTTPVKVFGTVVDWATGKAIADARVENRIAREHPSYKSIQKTLSDYNGRFEIRSKILEEHLLTVSARGYESNSIPIWPGDFAKQTEKRFEIRLHPRERAAAETWSPKFADGEKPDLGKILDEAKDFMNKGRYEEALQRYIWHHNHAQEFGDSYRNVVRLTSALSEWEELGRRYPKAKQALIEIRDDKTAEILEGRGYVEIFHEVQAINDELQNDEATFALFKTIHEKDPKLARRCYFYAEAVLIKNGEYQLCLDLMGGAQQRFNSLQHSIQMQRDNEKRMAESYARIAEMNRQRGITNNWSPPNTSEMFRKSGEDYFVGGVCRLIEILIGAGQKADAENIRDQALAVLNDSRLKSAIIDGEKKVAESKNRFALSLPELEEARAKIAELRVEYTDEHPLVKAQLARLRELERMAKEEPAATAALRAAKAQLAELRTEFTDGHPEVRKLKERIRELEAK